MKLFKKKWLYLQCLARVKALNGQRLGRHTYRQKAFLYALVLMVWESRKFIDKSRTKQRERPKGCIIYSPHWLRMQRAFVGREGILYTYIGVGAFSVVRFRLVGQCESLWIVKRATEWLYAFSYVSTKETMTKRKQRSLCLMIFIWIILY